VKAQVAARAQVETRAQQAHLAKDIVVCESIETVAEYTTRAAAGERKWVAVAVAGGAGGVRCRRVRERQNCREVQGACC